MVKDENSLTSLENQVQLLFDGISNINQLHKYEKQLGDTRIYFRDEKFMDIVNELKTAHYEGTKTDLEIGYKVEERNKNLLEKAINNLNSIILNNRRLKVLDDKISLDEINRQLTKNSLFLDSSMREVETNMYLPQFSASLLSNAYNFLNSFLTHPDVEGVYNDWLNIGEKKLKDEDKTIKGLIDNIRTINSGSNYNLFDSYIENGSLKADSLAKEIISFPLMLDTLKKTIYIASNDPTITITTRQREGLTKNNLFCSREKYLDRLNDEDVLVKDLESRYEILKNISDELFFKGYQNLTQLQSDLFNIDKLNKFALQITDVIRNIKMLDSELEFFQKFGDDFGDYKFVKYSVQTSSSLVTLKEGIEKNFYEPIKEKGYELLDFFELKRDDLRYFVDEDLNIFLSENYVKETNQKIQTLKSIKNIYNVAELEQSDDFLSRVEKINNFSSFLIDETSVDCLKNIAEVKEKITKNVNHLVKDVLSNEQGSTSNLKILNLEKDVRSKYEIVKNLRTGLENLFDVNEQFSFQNLKDGYGEYQNKVVWEISNFYNLQKKFVNEFLNEYISDFLDSRFKVLFGEDINFHSNEYNVEDVKIKSGLVGEIGRYDVPKIFDLSVKKFCQLEDFVKLYTDFEGIEPFLREIDFIDKEKSLSYIKSGKDLTKKAIIQNIKNSIDNLKSYHNYIKVNSDSSYLAQKKIRELKASKANSTDDVGYSVMEIIKNAKEISSVWNNELAKVSGVLELNEEIDINYNNLLSVIEQFSQSYNRLLLLSKDANRYNNPFFKFKMKLLERGLKKKVSSFKPMGDSILSQILMYSHEDADTFNSISTIILDNNSDKKVNIGNPNLPYNGLTQFQSNFDGVLYTNISTEKSEKGDRVKQRLFEESFKLWQNNFSKDNIQKMLEDLTCYLDDNYNQKKGSPKSEDFVLFYDSEGKCNYLTNNDHFSLIKITKNMATGNGVAYKAEHLNYEISDKFGPRMNSIELGNNESVLVLGNKYKQNLKKIESVFNPDQNNQTRLKNIMDVLEGESKNGIPLLLVEKKDNEHLDRLRDIVYELDDVKTIIDESVRNVHLKPHILFSKFDYVLNSFASLEQKKNRLDSYQESEYHNDNYFIIKFETFDNIRAQERNFFLHLNNILQDDNLAEVELINREVTGSERLKEFIETEKTKAYTSLINYMKSAGRGFSDLSDIVIRNDFKEKSLRYKELFILYNNLEKISEGKTQVVRDVSKLSYAKEIDRLEEFVSTLDFFEAEREVIIKDYVSTLNQFSKTIKDYENQYLSALNNKEKKEDLISLLIQNNTHPNEIIEDLNASFNDVIRSYGEVDKIINTKPQYLESDFDFNRIPKNEAKKLLGLAKERLENLTQPLVFVSADYNKRQV
jgi:hypothetical protein